MMKYILYNTQTQQLEGNPYEGEFSSIYNSGLNETLGWLPEYVVQLTIVDNVATYDPATQTVSSTRIVDLPNLEYKWEHTIQAKTNEQLIDELNQQAESIEQQLKDEELTKLIEHKVTETRELLTVLTDEEAIDFRTRYKPYKVPMTLKPGDKFYYPLNDKLYKVIGPEIPAEHTTQLDWKPDTAVSLYEHVFVAPPGDPCDTAELWNGANWASYTVGYIVKHNGAIWEAINGSHTWIAPSKTGDGAISWTWIKDCNK